MARSPSIAPSLPPPCRGDDLDGEVLFALDLVRQRRTHEVHALLDLACGAWRVGHVRSVNVCALLARSLFFSPECQPPLPTWSGAGSCAGLEQVSMWFGWSSRKRERHGSIEFMSDLRARRSRGATFTPAVARVE